MATVFCYFQILHMKSAKIIPTSSLKSKFAKFCPAKPEKSEIREIKLPQKFPTTRFQPGDVEIVNDFVYRAI